jgi:nucleoside-diphosphate-sugar epimerase
MTEFATLHLDYGLPVDDLSHAEQLVGAVGWRRLDGARVFVTGGTGFVGKWLLASALRATRSAGVSVEFVVLTRDPAAFAAAHPELSGAPGVSLAAGDVRTFDFPPGGFTHVVHAATDVAASNTPMETFDVTVAGTRRVLEFAVASGASELLLTSSGAVYGPQPSTMATIPETFLGGPSVASASSAYGEGKRVSEWLTQRSVDDGLAPRVARVFALVGPYLALDKHFAMGNFLADAMAGRRVEVNGDGTSVRSYLHAADLSGWLWALLLRGAVGATYNVGGVEAVSIADLAQRINDVLGSTAGVHVASNPEPGATRARYVPDVSMIQRDLGLAGAISLDDAIARTAAWHRGISGA